MCSLKSKVKINLCLLCQGLCLLAFDSILASVFFGKSENCLKVDQETILQQLLTFYAQLDIRHHDTSQLQLFSFSQSRKFLVTWLMSIPKIALIHFLITEGANWFCAVGFLWSKMVEIRGIFRYLKINSKQKDYAQSKAYFL